VSEILFFHLEKPWKIKLTQNKKNLKLKDNLERNKNIHKKESRNERYGN
jgi:hypothetical protein